MQHDKVTVIVVNAHCIKVQNMDPTVIVVSQNLVQYDQWRYEAPAAPVTPWGTTGRWHQMGKNVGQCCKIYCVTSKIVRFDQ